MNTLTPRKLTLSDIADVRAYEREREEFKARVLSLKERRRLSLGTIVSVMFENRETIRYQIQEMLRVEKTFEEEGIQQEIDAYAPLVPEGSN